MVVSMLAPTTTAYAAEYQESRGVKIGDIINLSPTQAEYENDGKWCHSVMFLDYVGTTGIKVLGCNWPSATGDASKKKSVKIHTLNYSAYDTMAITRARNYKPSNDTTAPVISDVKVYKDSAGYLIQCTVNDDIGVEKVAFATWTEANGQDDLASEWYNTELGTADGNTYTFKVADSDHNLERGYYITHIYAYDYAGNYSINDSVYVDVQNRFTCVRETIHKNSRYRLYEDLLTWEEAQAYCVDKGGHLATITSAEEQGVVASLVNGRDNYRDGYYLGGTLNNKQLSWVAGEAANYTNWSSGRSIGFVCEIEYPIEFENVGRTVEKGTTETITLKDSSTP